VTGDFGKPELAPRPEQPPISFNMAHSGNVILYALADGSRVGVDVEAIRTDLDVMELAQAQFSPQEVDHLRAISPSEVAEAFYHCWTRKEAYVKARGEGLGFPLKQFSVSFGSNEPFAVQWASDDPLVSERWSMFGVSPAPGYAGAIIVEGRPVRLVSRHWGDSGGRQK
jgi:4'-phosphopantetheinyl transferase